MTNKELDTLTFADTCVKGWLQQDKERLENWRKDREVLYSALERKEKLEKVVDIMLNHPSLPIKRVQNYIDWSKKYGWTLEDHKLENYDIDLTKEEYDLLKEFLK